MICFVFLSSTQSYPVCICVLWSINSFCVAFSETRQSKQFITLLTTKSTRKRRRPFEMLIWRYTPAIPPFINKRRLSLESFIEFLNEISFADFPTTSIFIRKGETRLPPHFYRFIPWKSLENV